MGNNPIDDLLSKQAPAVAQTPAPQSNPIDDILAKGPSIPAVSPNPIDKLLEYTAPSASTGGWTDTIMSGVKNMAYNTVVRPALALPQLGMDMAHGDLVKAQADIRKNIFSAMIPFANPEAIEKHVEVNPQAPVSGKGTWDTTKNVANIPVAGQFHRKGAGPIEGEAEDWATGQLNPLNIGLAIASMGSSAVESVLVKGGMPILKAAATVRYAKLATDLAFLSKFGYDVGVNAVPQLERDWHDYNNATDDKIKAQLMDKIEREGTDMVLGIIAAGWASRGVAHDVARISEASPKGQALKNTQYSDAVYDYQNQNQLHSAQAGQIHDQGVRAVPEEIRQEAISNNVEAAGDVRKLREWEAAAAKDQKAGYKEAQNLTEKERTLMEKGLGILNAWKERLRAQGLLSPDGGRQNYIPHKPVFEDTDPETGEPINVTGAEGERDFLKKRIYADHFSGEQHGIQYKTKHFVKLISDYIERAGNMIARNDLGEKLAQSNMNEGSPMAVSGGYVGVPADVPLTPADINILRAQGKLDDLIQSGRVYEVPRTPGEAATTAPNAPGGPSTAGPGPTPAGYTPSEKAELMSAPTKDYGPEFDAQQKAHEIQRYKDIQRNPQANAAARATAEQRLNELTAPPRIDSPEVIKSALRYGIFPDGEWKTDAGNILMFRDTVTGGGFSLKAADFSDKLIEESIKKVRASIDPQHLDPMLEAKRARAQAGYDQLKATQQGTPEQAMVKQPNWQAGAAGPIVLTPGAKFVGATPGALGPRYMWKFSDYTDSGLRVNRPLVPTNDPMNALIKFPDPNGAVNPEAIISEGQGGYPTDPRTGKSMQRVPVYVHPDIREHLQGMLNSIAPSGAMKYLLKASSGVKSVLLSLAPFHWVTVTNRMLEANPTFAGLRSIGSNFHDAIALPTPIDYFNLSKEQLSAIKDGVVVSNTRPGYSDYTQEGNVAGSRSFASRLPLIGHLNHWIEGRLFGPQGYITGMKFDLYDKLKADHIARGMDPVTAGRTAASQVNNKFGGLNYAVMGRSASTQNALRAMLLAPDFLESTGRSVADVAGKFGAPLVQSLVAFNALHWMVARSMNKIMTGEYHPETGFKVVAPDGKREYGLRTTLGDFLHFAEHPRDFLMNRVNPMLVRTPLELLTGVDAQGNKVSPTQLMWDTIRQVTPIAFQAATPKQTITQPNPIDEILKSFGVQSSKRFSPAETLAYQRSTQQYKGQALEGKALADAQQRFKLSDELRDAMKSKDKDAIKKATDAVVKAGQGANPLLTYKQVSESLKDAAVYNTRLEANVHHLPLADALDVYEMAGLEEKKALRTIISQKIMSWWQAAGQGRKKPGEVNSMLPKVEKFFHETKPSAPPTTISPGATNPIGFHPVPGMIQPGNIKLNNRPVVKNDDGSESTEYSVSIANGKGQEVLLPTIVDGRFLTPNGKIPIHDSKEEKEMFRAAWQHYLQTGEHLGIFDTPEHANSYANIVHNRGL